MKAYITSYFFLNGKLSKPIAKQKRFTLKRSSFFTSGLIKISAAMKRLGVLISEKIKTDFFFY